MRPDEFHKTRKGLRAAKLYLKHLKAGPEEVGTRDRRDAESINAYADELNVKAKDVLGHQAEW